MAANGMLVRRETGVRISPTTIHAISAPAAAANTEHAECNPAQRVGQRAHRHRPRQHVQRRRKEDAVGCHRDSGGNDILPQRNGSPWRIDG